MRQALNRDQEHFEFGANWAQYLKLLNEERIVRAEESLSQMLGTERLSGQRFLDIGSGSGVFSLAARRLGAVVTSFDVDRQSVACTRALKARFFADDPDWSVLEGSVLDDQFLNRLGQFDVVYSWGVLHHTGQMWKALANVDSLVAEGGQLFIAIYNDQGTQSKLWRGVKRVYNRLPSFLRIPYVIAVMFPYEMRALLVSLAMLQPSRFIRSWTHYKSHRGMSHWHDLVDWVGGYPFEVARPEEIFRFSRDRGYVLREMTTQGVALGCNEFVFEKRIDASARARHGA
jgi:2-polyprenyl-6-hydroxyphenyl methylase/3-demethylubiquinone-9 3-methyltransferase